MFIMDTTVRIHHYSIILVPELVNQEKLHQLRCLSAVRFLTALLNCELMHAYLYV